MTPVSTNGLRAAMRVQQQRQSNPLQMKYGNPISSDLGWDEFFGLLQQKADDAAAAGMNFKIALPRSPFAARTR